MGKVGTGVLMAFLTISYLIFALKVKPESFGLKIPSFLKVQKTKRTVRFADRQKMTDSELIFRSIMTDEDRG